MNATEVCDVCDFNLCELEYSFVGVVSGDALYGTFYGDGGSNDDFGAFISPSFLRTAVSEMRLDGEWVICARISFHVSLTLERIELRVVRWKKSDFDK